MKVAIYTLGCKVNQYETQAKSDNTAETAPSPVDFLEWITDC